MVLSTLVKNVIQVCHQIDVVARPANYYLNVVVQNQIHAVMVDEWLLQADSVVQVVMIHAIGPSSAMALIVAAR